MVREIYIRDENDPYFNPRKLEVTDEIEMAITQVRMILGTEKGDVLGSPDFGINLEDYIFKTKRNSTSICDELDEQIASYVQTGPNIRINTELNFGDSGEGYDYGLLDIYINGEKALGFLIDKDNDE